MTSVGGVVRPLHVCVWVTVYLLRGGFQCRVRLREKEMGEEVEEEEEEEGEL